MVNRRLLGHTFGVVTGRQAWAPNAHQQGARRTRQRAGTAHSCARRVPPVRAHCALDPVFGFLITIHGHCSLTLFMDIVQKKKKKMTPRFWGVTWKVEG